MALTMSKSILMTAPNDRLDAGSTEVIKSAQALLAAASGRKNTSFRLSPNARTNWAISKAFHLLGYAKGIKL
jgi:hypothetical protein